jgi:hypothetical protein
MTTMGVYTNRQYSIRLRCTLSKFSTYYDDDDDDDDDDVIYTRCGAARQRQMARLLDGASHKKKQKKTRSFATRPAYTANGAWL